MKLMLWLLALSGYSITVNCSLNVIAANPGGIGGIYKGPDSETIVQGPDGSVITSQQEGGIIQTESKLDPIIVADQQILNVGHPEIVQSVTASPIAVSTLGALSETVVAPLEPVIPGTIAANVATIPVGKPIEIVEQDPHIIETEIIDPPAIELKESTDLVGPSGSISTRGSESIVSGPASTTITKAAKILIAAPKISGVPILSAISTPIHAPPLVEVNNEIPLSSPIPLNPISLPNLGHIGVSTVAPSLAVSAVPQPAINQGLPLYPINGPSVSTASPPLSIASTLTPPAVNQEVRLLPNDNLRVTPLDNGGLGSLPILRQPLPLNQQRILNFDDTEHVRHLGPINPSLLQPAPVGPTQRPLLLTGEQYDDYLRPGGVVSTVSPPIGSSTPESISGISISTEDNSRLVQIGGVQSSTAVPVSSSVGFNPRQNVQNIPNEWLLNRHLVIDPAQIPQHNIVPPETEDNRRLVQISGVQSSTALSVSSSLDINPRQNVQNIPKEWLLNRHLVIDPAQIPQHNIVPPETGIPKGLIDLGSTVQTHTTTAPSPDINGLPRAIGLSSPNIQRIDKNNNNNVQVDTNSLQRINNNVEPTEVERTFQNGYYQNEILVGNTGGAPYSQSPVTNNVNPVPSEISIPSRGILDRELTKADIDSSQIQLTNVPLSDVTGLQSGPESGRTRDYDDNVAASLWNRYGRKRRNRKY